MVPRTLRAEDALLILEVIPRGKGALLVVLDNGSIHISHVIIEVVVPPSSEQAACYTAPTTVADSRASSPAIVAQIPVAPTVVDG